MSVKKGKLSEILQITYPVTFKTRLECFNACNKAYFPQLTCVKKEGLDFYFKKNYYNDLYVYPRPLQSDFVKAKVGTQQYIDQQTVFNNTLLKDFKQCEGYILDYQGYKNSLAEPERQTRTHTCFSYCRNGEDANFIGDERPDCISLNNSTVPRDQMVCLYPDETCEKSSVSKPAVLFTVSSKDRNGNEIKENLLYAPELGLLAILIANPCQILWDLMTHYLRIIKIDKDNPKHGSLLLGYQMLVVVIFVSILFYSLNLLIKVIETGDSFLIFVTFGITFAIDQAKQIVTLSIIYLVVARRFGFLKVNEKEFVDPVNLTIKKENAIPRFMAAILKTLETQYAERLSLILIGVYTFFILFDLTLSQFFDINPQTLLDIDFGFLTIFFTEILLKTFASGGDFLKDGFNMFDAIIVILSYALMIEGFNFKGLGVLRLIRVVVITIRSITGNKSRLRHQTKMKDPLGAVVAIFKQLSELPISNTVKKEARFIVTIIEQNKLYELAMDMNGEGQQDMEAKAWLNVTTEQANDTTLWFERDLDDFLKEIHREEMEIDQNQLEEDEERLRQIINVSTRQWATILKLTDNFEKWEFDVFEYAETLGENILVHFGFRLFQQYGLLEKFSIADQNFVSLINGIKNTTYEQNSYHNLTKIVELTRNFHFFVKKGELMRYFSDLNIMSAFLACLLCDI